MKGVYSMNKHNWNQLSASSKRYLEQAQNDRMINESYQDGYRQGLSERGPGPGAYASNRQQGQRFDRFGNPIATGGPARSIGPANPYSLQTGDELGMLMQWQMPDDFVPPSLQAKLDAIDPVKNPPPKWTMMPNDPNEDERMYEHYRRRMYEQSGMGAGNAMSPGNAMTGRMTTASRPPVGGGGGPRSGGPGEPGGQGPPQGGCDHCQPGHQQPGPGGSLWEWNGEAWFRQSWDSCRGERCSIWWDIYDRSPMNRPGGPRGGV